MDTSSYKSGNPKYDLHLSAHEIKPLTITQLEKLGFVRDEFANNRYCDTTKYHGTFPNWKPNEELHDLIVSTLSRDETFNGGLEEEVVLPSFRSFFTFEPHVKEEDSVTIRYDFFRGSFPFQKAIPCPAEKLKACDIHISVDWQRTGKETKQAFDQLEIVSFDKPKLSEDGFNRIFTLTFENLANGVNVFHRITEMFSIRNGEGVNFCGKVKLEITTQIYRKPLDGTMLPLILKY